MGVHLNELRAKGADELVVPIYADTDRSLVRMLYGFGPTLEPLPGCQAFFPAEELNSVPELLKDVKGLKVVDGELAVISLSRLDRIREDEEAMLEVSKELGIQ